MNRPKTSTSQRCPLESSTQRTGVLLLNLFLLAVFGHSTVTRSADWPQFRGADRTGISGEKNLDLDWSETGPKVLWKRVSGEGFSGMSVVDGRMYTQLGIGAKEYLFAIDVTTGKDLWRLEMDDKYENSFGNGPRSTPTVKDGFVYAISSLGALVAVDTGSGKALWQRNLRDELGAKVPTWGISTQITVEGDLLLLDAGGKQSVVGLDKTTGKTVWGALSDLAGYSTPVVADLAGKRQAIFFTGTRVASVEPKTGQVLWTFPWQTEYDVNAATPIIIPPNRLFIASGYGHGGAVLEVRADGGEASVQEIWSSRGIKNQFSSSIYYNGHIYGFDEKILKCLDAATGEEKWKGRGYGHGSLTLADGHLIALGDKGRLGIVEATPEGFRESSAYQALEGKSWTVPTLANGTLLIRNEREIIALDLTP